MNLISHGMTYDHPFHRSYSLSYGLHVCSRNATSGKVTACVCRFCEVYGREDNVPGKRKRTTKSKYFYKKFRSDNIRTHLETQHKKRWSEYRSMATHEKERYFRSEGDGRGGDGADSEEDGDGNGNSKLVFWFRAGIVDDVIGGVFFDGESENESRDEALRLFKLEEREAHGDTEGESGYNAEIRNVTQFNLVVDYVACGSSFRLAARILESTKRRTGLAKIGSCDGRKIAQLLRIVCAANLQKVSEMLEESWAFSVALDMGNKSSVSYLDVRVRVARGTKLHNVHLLAIPISGSHTASNMYESFSKVMNAMLPEWKQKVIGVTTDGAAPMVGRHQGFATRLEREALPGFFRVWCAAHQLNLVVQASIKHICDEAFLDQLTRIIGYLRRQQNLASEMGSTCPRFADTRWLSMGKVVKWLTHNRDRVCSYMQEKEPSCKPSSSWWVTLIGLTRYIRAIDYCCTRVQGLATLLTEQRVELDNLVSELVGLVGAEGPLDDDERNAVDLQNGALFGKYAVTRSNAREYLEDLGIFAIDMLENLSIQEEAEVTRSIAALFAETIDGVARVVAERDSSNGNGAFLPPVLPHALTRIAGRTFSKHVRDQRLRLKTTFSQDHVNQLENEHSELLELKRRDARFRDEIERFTGTEGFEEGWSSLRGRFPSLCNFAGGLATVFPGTSAVEADFSLISWEKNDYRSQLSNLSLEGILHAKQYERLKAVSTL